MEMLELLGAKSDQFKQCLDSLESNDIRKWLIFELKQLQIKIENMENYQTLLKLNNDILKYDIDKLNQEISSTRLPQPCYNNIKRITNSIQLKLLSKSFDQQSNYQFIGQIIKKKDCSSLMFIELFIAPSYLIKIAFKKQHFSKQKYNEMRSKCRLGSIIECNGRIEDYNADKLVLVIDKLELIKLFERKGFEPYKETNKQKSKDILCSHLIKHYVSECKDTTDINLTINTQFLPPICIKSKCLYRHRLRNQTEISKIMEQCQVRNNVLNEEFDENDPFYSSKESKVARARLFGEWIVNKYGITKLQQNGVLDIAGGGGDLAMVLSEYDIPVTIIDPRKPVKMFKKMEKKKKKLNKKMDIEIKEDEEKLMIPQHISAYFEWNTLDINQDIKEIFDKCQVVLGLHPDQATEPIVDLSLKHNKSFAILPCCVFPNLYPKYMMVDDQKQEVVTYVQFIEYLQGKNKDISIDYLKFKGRNKILSTHIETNSKNILGQ